MFDAVVTRTGLGRASCYSKPRHYSFILKNPDRFDQVAVGGTIYVIPARAGSCLWAVLRACYEHADERVFADGLVQLVAELLRDRDPQRWAAYQSKARAKPWQDRVLMSARMLTRGGGSNPYGLRLIERGHLLTSGHDEQGRLYFLLRTDGEREPTDGSGSRGL
jgi:hypothetical protein